MAAKTWDEIYGAGASVDLAPADIDLSDKDALRKLATEKLVRVIAKSPDTIACVPAIRELLDRIDGKPGQAITMESTVNNTLTISIDDRRRYAAEEARAMMQALANRIGTVIEHG
jgi:hypothetical protein